MVSYAASDAIGERSRHKRAHDVFSNIIILFCHCPNLTHEQPSEGFRLYLVANALPEESSELNMSLLWKLLTRDEQFCVTVFWEPVVVNAEMSVWQCWPRTIFSPKKVRDHNAK